MPIVLHPSTFTHPSRDSEPTYWYEGRCPQSREWLRLPRTAEVEAIARDLMQQLDADEFREGKMIGVLLVEAPPGTRVLKAFSGLLNGNSIVEGWVPPIPGRDRVALAEAQTLAQLDALKQELIALHRLPERQQYALLSQTFAACLQDLSQNQQQRKQERQQQRQALLDALSGDALALELERLNDQSRRDKRDRRRLKQERDSVLQPLQQTIAQADTRMRLLKQRRKALSRQLQSQMHASYQLTNFAGQSFSLQQLLPDGMPTGTGDCCAPKLLHYAAAHGFKPVAMAEFWWGSSTGDRVQGEFYGACEERCQPLMGFLLSGLTARSPSPAAAPLSILYEDDWLIAVNKPTGLLSVPGRYHDRQDSVLSRLALSNATAVHRLDQDTSGILLLARHKDSDRRLRQQFQQHTVHKVYEAILAGRVTADKGVIDLPLWSDPDDRPYQKVDYPRGKPSITRFQVLDRTADTTRVVFLPLTGRTHQLRVHAAAGLNTPILGDRLYGSGGDRLYLHAKNLHIEHPHSGQRLHLHAPTPF